MGVLQLPKTFWAIKARTTQLAEPAPITEKEAELILQRIDDSVEKPKPKTIFEESSGN